MASHSLSAAPAKASTSRKLSKRAERRKVRMEIPECFRGEDEGEEDGGQPEENNPEAYIQQSMYGVIAAAHSKGNLRTTLQPLSGSESESESEGNKGSKKEAQRTVSETVRERSTMAKKQGKASSPSTSRHRKNKMSESLRGMLKPVRERSDTQNPDAMSRSQYLPPKESTVAEETGRPTTAVRRDAPIMDRKLQAKARADMQYSAQSEARSSMDGTPPGGPSRMKAPLALPDALAEIFHFDAPEDVISEYACWFLQSVLLQGYMYITQKHVCFYAYLQKKGNVIKSGHLAKQGKRTARYRRYWFALKGDVLSYYTSAAEPYFPSGTVDLRYAISADMAPEKPQDKAQDKNKDTTEFTVTTENRTYYLRADSASSAKEWVRQLQKVIFRSHNDGDSVKICLPLDNIVDVEPNPVIESAETVKIRVIDSDETFAIDEYFFTFFNNGKDALNVISLMTQDNDAKRAAAEMAEEESALPTTRTPPLFRRSISVERSPRLSWAGGPSLPEPVRSTLSPLSAADRSSPRHSSEQARSSTEASRTSFDRGRASLDSGRRSASATRRASRWTSTSKSPLSPSAEESDSLDEASAGEDGKYADMSASQVLSGDRIFRGPTLRMPQPRRTVSGSTVERLRQESRESSPNSPGPERIRVQPPSRTQTEQTVMGSPTEASSSESGYFDKQKSNDKELRNAERQVPIDRPKRALATPLQHAYTFAGVVRSQGKRMSSYLSSSPKSYYEKFSGAIAGGKRHYTEVNGLAPEDRVDDAEEYLDRAEHEQRFRQHFDLPNTERLRAVYYCWLHRVLPLYGKVYISDRRFCFRSLLYGTRTKLVVPFKQIVNAGKEKGFRWGYPGMVLVIRGHEELFFDFGSQGVRDDCVVTVLRGLDVTRAAAESFILTDQEEQEAQDAALEHELLQDARKDNYGVHDHKIPHDVDQKMAGVPIVFDDPSASVLDFRPKRSLRITCLTIGSRGDVQPYIALCKGLKAHGHHVKIATHTQFEGWVTKHGIEFANVEGDPHELMRLCVENGMFTPSFVLETNSKARGWLDELLRTTWKACQNSDLLIESPSAMAGIHIAEALGIPYFRAFGMPWTKTRAYPHAFAVPNAKMGGQYNYMTYVIFENLFWTMTMGQINRWRRKTLNLPPTDLGKLQINKVPFLYNFSPSVVVPPLDFSDWIRVTGYWFLDEADEWTPPEDLLAFIKKARDDGAKLVYIGFGSIPVSDSKQLTQQIVDAVLKADVRCIFSKGWSDHFEGEDANAPELPSAIYQIRSAPHDWLFNQIDAAVHHGGAGTTGASLRAGLPTVIKPYFGDQFFFATRAEDLGVGIHLKKVTVNSLGKALWLATNDERMRTKARMLGEQIRQENGVDNAINAIYRDLDYAKTLIKKRELRIGGDEEDDNNEESWTFVDNDSDVEVMGARRTEGFNSYTHGSRQPSLGSVVLRGRAT
ncbi:Sterol 3-beta-glucosyltransferase [Vermiconidia calcicola]|uniref:Sterol 3-beta-glucosyltransferase n=1 Tax=Vermiconidia calcicola TaxID=1690605 RepID=A0ACC3N2Z8_9PEZI|nr:Sterol 3-beta-glucosyltransferase [Vermiconidia calcicola]